MLDRLRCAGATAQRWYTRAVNRRWWYAIAPMTVMACPCGGRNITRWRAPVDNIGSTLEGALEETCLPSSEARREFSYQVGCDF